MEVNIKHCPILFHSGAEKRVFTVQVKQGYNGEESF